MFTPRPTPPPSCGGDLINVSDWGVVTDDDPYTFNNTSRRQESRTVRLGIEYRY